MATSSESQLKMVISAVDEVSSTVNSINSKLQQLNGTVDKSGKVNESNAASIFKGVAAWDLLKGAMQSISGQLNKYGADSQYAALQQKVLNSTLESTKGAAGMSAKAVNDLASSLMEVTNLDDDVIITGQNMLLTFTKISRDVFPQATEAMINMATAMNSGVTPSAEQLKGTAIQLGKALNDPVAGSNALRRVGVALSETQMEQIKSFVKLGDVASAQKVILAELETEFGNLGRNTANPTEQLKVQLDNIGESISLNVLPYINAFASAVSGMITWVIKFYKENETLVKTIVIVGTVLAASTAISIAWVLTLEGIAAAGGLAAIATSAFATATTFAARAMVLLNAVPIVALLSLVAVAAVLLINRFGGVRNAIIALKDILAIVGQSFVVVMKYMYNAVVEGLLNPLLERISNTYNVIVAGLNKVGANLKTVDFKIPKLDATENLNTIISLRTGIANLSIAADNQKKSTEGAKNAFTGFPGSSDSINKAKDGADKMTEALKRMHEATTAYTDDAKNAYTEVAEKVGDLQKKIADLDNQNSSANRELDVSFAEAYVKALDGVKKAQDDVTKKDNEVMQALSPDEGRVRNESDLQSKQAELSNLKQDLKKRQDELLKYNTVAIAYSDEIAEVQRKNNNGDLTNSIETLNLKRVKLEEEYNNKRSLMVKELAAEVEKQAVLMLLAEQASKEIEKNNAINEKSTIESVNKQIEAWNALAKAIADAKAGKQSGFISSLQQEQKITSINAKQKATPPVNIYITGNTVFDEKKFSETILNSAMKQLNNNVKVK